MNLKQKGPMADHIEDFQILNIKEPDIRVDHMIEFFIGTSKDNIQHEVFLWEPNSLENAFRVARKFERKAMETSRSTSHKSKYGSVSSSNLP